MPELDETPPPPLKVLLEASALNVSAESIIRAVGDLLFKKERDHHLQGKLIAIIAFEFSLVQNLLLLERRVYNQACLMVEESDCSYREKCQMNYGKFKRSSYSSSKSSVNSRC